MENTKTLTKPSINKLLYDARNYKKITLKDASKGLGISKLHLKLIERGYLRVSKKLEPTFIKYYKLPKDFFKANSTYVTPINVNYDDPHLEEKARNNIRKTKTKIISGVISAMLLGALGTGIYFYNRYNVNPKVEWSKDFTTFRNELITHPDGKKPSKEYIGDTEYYIEGRDRECAYLISIPSKDVNATGLVIKAECRGVDTTAYVYNKKKILYIEVNIKQYDYHAEALCTFTTRGKYNIPSVTVSDYLQTTPEEFRPGSKEYKQFCDIAFDQDEGYDKAVSFVNESLKKKGFTNTYDEILNDTQKVSEYQVFGFRLGFRMILYSLIILILSLSVFIYAMITGRKKKEKKEKPKPYVIHKLQYNTDVALAYRGFTSDIKFPLIIPEFVLRIIALAILLLASIGSAWLTNDILTGQESLKSTVFNGYVSNFLVAGITLAFFLKLDVYHKKTHKELLENILMLFVFGLIFYTAECVTYASLSSQGTIYSDLIKLLSGLLPGNIIWNLMFYSLIFLFLFTLPKKIEDQPHKVLLWRLGSVIPTLFLIAAFIYQGTFKGEASPYVSFLFHTNGLLSTAFAIFYLYSLFFYQQYVNLKYGKEFMNTFLDSRRYALYKNIIACVVLFLLTIIDLAFYFKLPDNYLNLGNNWIIAILIPFILFYRPHIGKRMVKWDLAYTVMYVLFLTGGLIISFSMIANALDLQQIANIIN